MEGTGALIRLALRRDRFLLPAWVSLIVVIVVASASATSSLYPTVESRVAAAGAINSSPALMAMYGPIQDPTSLGAVAMVKLVAFGAAAVAVLAAMITVRHSRSEEESGRLELIGATVVGRGAPLTAALAVAAAASLAIGIFSFVGLVATGLPVAGALAFGAGWAGTGMAFAAVAAVTVQVARTARGATGLAIGVVGVAYVLRAVGDAGTDVRWLSWVSPLGWMHEISAFAGNRFIVLLLYLALFTSAVAVAYTLRARRDLGAGLLPDRPGPARAGVGLQSALGLAWRLERGALLVWAVAFALLGLVVGSLADSVGSFLSSGESQDFIRRLGGDHALPEAFLAAEFGVLGVVIAAYGVHAALRLRTEENADRAGELLATGVSRLRWALSHLTVALVGTTCLAAAAGLAAGIAYARTTGDTGDVSSVLGGVLVQLPAVWVVVGIAMLAFGIGPRFAAVGWVGLVTFLVLGEFGSILHLPEAMIDLSPFAHVPKLPGSTMTATPVAVLLVVAALLTGLGLAALRRRDIA